MPTNSPAEGAKPQIAYRLFTTWADSYMANARRGKVIGETVLYSTGAIALAGAALTWYGGDAISNNVSGSPMDPQLKQNLAMGLGIGGISFLAIGSIVSSVPIKDYRALYADVYEEKNPEVQEAMAASVLRYQSDKGKESRITSFITGLVVPLAAAAITGGINAAQGNNWSDGLLNALKGSSWTMCFSLVSLFQKTPEERLYDRYLATRDALYGSAK